MHQVIEFYQQNLQLARETSQRRDEMSALASLGRAYEALEDRDKAVEFYELALKIARDVGDGRAERQTLKHLNEALNPQAGKDESRAKPVKKSARGAKKPTKSKARKSPVGKTDKATPKS